MGGGLFLDPKAITYFFFLVKGDSSIVGSISLFEEEGCGVAYWLLGGLVIWLGRGTGGARTVVVLLPSEMNMAKTSKIDIPL